ncbi:hypothetical protein ACIQ1D_01625 [Lysinibacillus xylanilyticus]|uniref:hypothetical protein n=1 Tax=Lysinibacillus xylanilyticus TaxID=582475 RepID=UPI00382C762C
MNAVPYFEVWRYDVSQPTAPSSNSSNNKSSSQDKLNADAIAYFKKTMGVFSLAKSFRIDGIKIHQGIAQYINYDLCNGARGKSKSFGWTNNGIPFSVSFKYGCQFKVGDMINPDIHGTIDEYDDKSEGVGVRLYGLDSRDYGVIWFNADALLNRY